MDALFIDILSSPKIESIVIFLLNFIYYLIPCLLGSVVNYYLKKRDNCNYKPIQILLYSITPSMILSMTDELLKNNFNLSSSILLGVSFFGGLVCDEITNMFSTLKNIMKIYSQFKNIIKAIKSVSDELEKFSSESNGDDKTGDDSS